jgi:hypothetical protein
MDKIKYGTFEIDFDALPDASKLALVSRGVTHFLGNEQNSKGHSFAVAQVKGDGKEEPSKDAVKEWKTANAEALVAKVNELTATAYAALLDGTVGARSAGGPRLTPIDTLVRQKAKVEVSAKLASIGAKFPKKDETITFGDGTRTGDQMIDNWLANGDNLARLTKAAEKELKAKEAAIAAAKEAVPAGAANLSDLGL